MDGRERIREESVCKRSCQVWGVRDLDEKVREVTGYTSGNHQIIDVTTQKQRPGRLWGGPKRELWGPDMRQFSWPTLTRRAGWCSVRSKKCLIVLKLQAITL